MWSIDECKTVNCSVVSLPTIEAMKSIDERAEFKYDNCHMKQFGLSDSQVVISPNRGYIVITKLSEKWHIQKIRYLSSSERELSELLISIGRHYEHVVFSIPARIMSRDAGSIRQRDTLLTIASNGGYGVTPTSLKERCLDMFYPSSTTPDETIADANVFFKISIWNDDYKEKALVIDKTYKPRKLSSKEQQMIQAEEATLTDAERQGYMTFKRRLITNDKYANMYPHVVSIWRKWQAVDQCELCQRLLSIGIRGFEVEQTDAIDHVHSMEGSNDSGYRGRLCFFCNMAEGMALRMITHSNNDDATNVDFGQHVSNLVTLRGLDDKITADYLSRKTSQYNEQSVIQFYTDYAINEYEIAANEFLTHTANNIQKRLPEYKGRQHDLYKYFLDIGHSKREYRNVATMLEHGTYDFDSVSMYVDREEAMEAIRDLTNQLRIALLEEFNKVI